MTLPDASMRDLLPKGVVATLLGLYARHVQAAERQAAAISRIANKLEVMNHTEENTNG